MSALTQAEAATRAGLIDVESYDVLLDLAADPVRSRTEIRFRCREPGAATFADVTAAVRSAVLGGRGLEPNGAGRLSLPGLEAENMLAVGAEVAYSRDGRGLTRFTDQADGATYVLTSCYPTHAPSIFCCFDQPDLVSATAVSVAVPAGWECVTNGPVEQRPAPGQAGVWRFGTVRGARPYDLTICAGPYVQDWRGSGGPVAMSIWRRRSLAGADGVAQLARFGQIAQQALAYYDRVFRVPCPYPKYDILFVPELPALAMSIPGLMLVNESLLARLPDTGDDVVAMVCAHEVAHLWFGCDVSMRWWDDLWLDEAMATYVSYAGLAEVGASADPWTAFCYREKPRAYLADELPGRQPVSSPVASAADALLRPAALTYSKGASVIRQLAALIGDDALRAGVTDYLRRFSGGTADLDDLAACWSRASGRDLSGWADEWLRTVGAPALRAPLTARPGRTVGSLAVLQDEPRTHRIGIGLYDLAGDRLRRRRVVSAEVSGPRTLVSLGDGEVVPDALVLNDGDLTYATIGLDEGTLGALAAVAMDVGDQLTEAVCWNAVWHMVLAGELAAADFAGLVVRGLGRAGTWPVAAAEVLIERAVRCADRYAPPADRAGLRDLIADACLAAAGHEPAGGPRQRALAAGFAASAHGDGQLEVLRSWLEGTSRVARARGPEIDADLRARILMTLSARGLASDDDLHALAGSDPVGGETNRATCSAMRPDAAAKEAAWRAALAAETDWRMAEAHARGVWVPGQEALMTGFRDRYFAEALPALDGRDPRVVRHLAEPLYPATLAGPDTLAATGAALEGGSLGHALRVVVTDQEAMMRSVLAARSVVRRSGWPAPLFAPLLASLLVEGAGVRGDVDRVLAEHVQRDDLQRALVGGGQYHRGGGAVVMRAQPVRRGHAPPVPRHQAGEAELRHRRGQVIADAALMREEFRGHHRADRVAAQVFGAGRAAPVPVEPGERIGSTWLELAAEYISVAHACSIGTPAAGRKIAGQGTELRINGEISCLGEERAGRPARHGPVMGVAAGHGTGAGGVAGQGAVGGLSLDCMVSQYLGRQLAPAPIDRSGLDEALRPFGESRMLPRAAYVDPAVFEWEQRNFFGGGWVCVARGEQLPEPGDQRAEATGSGGVLLVRDEDGVLRAFANSCRHRGHELLACGESSRGKAIICPYHAWTYSLAGELHGASGFRKVPGFDFSQWGLPRLPVSEWHGLVFVDTSGGAAGSLDEALAKLDEVVAPYEPERLVTAGRHSYDAAANWKILTENYHECYHCPSIHPELCRVSPPKSGDNYAADGAWVGGWMDLRDGMDTMSLDGTSRGVPLRGLDRLGLRTVIYVNIFPNVLLSLHPDYVMTHRLVPVATDKTRIECTWAFAPEAVARPDFDPGYAVEFWDITNRQDWTACESVQRGLSSPHASPGPLSPDEDAVYSFVTTIARGYLGQSVWSPGSFAA